MATVTVVTNTSDGTFTFPLPYSGVLAPGASAALSDDVPTVIANLGGYAEFGESLKISIATGAASASQHAINNSVTGAGLSAGAMRMLTSVGHNGAGAVTLTGAKVGDTVIGVSNITDHVTAAASFEATITTVDQIQQTSVTDLSAKTIIVMLVAKS